MTKTPNLKDTENSYDKKPKWFVYDSRYSLNIFNSPYSHTTRKQAVDYTHHYVAQNLQQLYCKTSKERFIAAEKCKYPTVYSSKIFPLYCWWLGFVKPGINLKQVFS